MISASKILANAIEPLLNKDRQFVKILAQDGEITSVARELEGYCRNSMPLIRCASAPLIENCLEELLKSVLWVDVVKSLRKVLEVQSLCKPVVFLCSENQQSPNKKYRTVIKSW